LYCLSLNYTYHMSRKDYIVLYRLLDEKLVSYLISSTPISPTSVKGILNTPSSLNPLMCLSKIKLWQSFEFSNTSNMMIDLNMSLQRLDVETKMITKRKVFVFFLLPTFFFFYIQIYFIYLIFISLIVYV